MIKVIGYTSTFYASTIREFLVSFCSMEYCEYNLLSIFRGECIKPSIEILELVQTKILDKIPTNKLRLYIEHTERIEDVIKYSVQTFGVAAKYLPMYLDMDPVRFRMWSMEFTRCAIQTEGPVDLVHVNKLHRAGG